MAVQAHAVLGFLAILHLTIVCGQSTWGSCPADRKLVEVESNADVVIGAVLDLHRPGDGVFGCGQPSAEGLHYFEALRWAIQRLNKKDGFLNGRDLTDSFIPGVEFGLQAYDSCNHKELSTLYLTELFPILTQGQSTCHPIKENATRVIGMVDATGSSTNPRMMESITKYLIPVIPLNQATTVPPEQLAKALAEVVHDISWERVAILHADDEYSLYVTKVFGQISFSGFPCIAAMKSFSASSSTNEASLRKIISSLTGKLPDNTGIIVVAGGDHLNRILQELQDSPELSRLQWLFSWLPSPEELQDTMTSSDFKNVYSLSLYPQKVTDFESYWAKLQDVATSRKEDDYWFLDYVSFKKHCRVAGHQGKTYGNTVSCENLIVKEMPLERLMRTSRFLPALHSTFTFAHAYKKAWQDKCFSVPGMCADLRSMTRMEFVEHYLEPLQFEHLPEFRSPGEVRGQKTNSTARGEMDSVQMALNTYFLNQDNELNFKQVFAYDSLEAKVLDDKFRYQPSICLKKGCTNCISIRQSRVDSSEHDLTYTDDFVTVANSEDVLIPILLPLHDAGSNPMECGKKLNQQAVQDLEAALWTIDQINEDSQYLQGVKLGAVAIDTCSSPLTLTQRLSNYLMEMQQKTSDEFTSSLAVVFSGSTEEFLAASAILSPLNVTIVSSSDAIRADRMKENFLQTAIPVETKVEAVVQLLKYMGWSYVPVLYDHESNNYELLKIFKKLADENNICLATELAITNLDQHELDFVVMQLIQVKAQGAKVIVLWAGEITTNVFLDGVRRAIAAEIIDPSDFVIICNGEWVKDLNSFRGFDNQTIGALTVKSEQGMVTDFDTYYQRLQPMRNRRNPWFAELYNAKDECTDFNCDIEINTLSPSTVNMIQAVLAISAGLARLRSDLCHPEQGLCSKFYQQAQDRTIFHKYIHETASSRLDFKGEMFTFTKRGYGNIPINILSFRKGVGNSLTHQKAGTYKDHRIEFTSSVIYSAVGEELALDDVTSQCSDACLTCGQKSPDFLVVDSHDDIYIASAMAVHESTKNPLVCSSVVTNRNMQILEAFLWAIDQINSSPQILPGVQLGSIVFDTCNSKEKVSRDISNFLSDSLRPRSKSRLPKIGQVMGFVATQRDEIAKSIVDVTMPFDLLTVATEVKSTLFNDVEMCPSLLRTSLPNDMIADGLVDLLKHFHWTYVSTVFSDESWANQNLFKSFEEQAHRNDIELAAVEKVSAGASEASMMNILTKLKDVNGQGARVVVLLLDEMHMRSFFTAVTKLQEIGRIEAKDFLWIGVDNLEAFHNFADISLGAIMLRQSSSTVLPFKQYFESLHLNNNTRNPWFREFWEQITKCHGASCYKKSTANHPPFIQDPAALNVINSVLSVGIGLESLRTRLCPQLTRGLCPGFKETPEFREMLLNITRSSTFMGADGELFKFTKRNFAAGTLKLYNFVQVGNNARAFVEIGKFSPDEGLSLNYSKVKYYGDNGSEVSPYNVKSECVDEEMCEGKQEEKSTYTMQIPSPQEFSIGAVMPIHRRGKTFFDCGELKDDSMFQNLAAIAYAIRKTNENETLLPNLSLGGIVFDYCGRRQKAEEQMYGYFSKDKVHQYKTKVTPRSVIASITFGETVAKDLAPILDASGVVQIAAPSDPTDYYEDNDILYVVPPSMVQIQVVTSILKKFRWNYVSLVYSNTDFGRSSYYQFSKMANEAGICLADVVMLEPDSTVQYISSALDVELESDDSKIVVILVDKAELINSTIEAAKRSGILHKYVWLLTNMWGMDGPTAESLRNTAANVVTIELEGNELPEFLDYFSSLNPRRHEPIPDSWFEEWWQHHFQCRLRNSVAVQIQYSRLCSGNERINKEMIAQDKHVFHTMKVVEAVARGLHTYLREKCPLGNAANNIDDCGPDARLELEKELKKRISGSDADCEECGPMGTMFGYNVFKLQLYESESSYVRIGNWKDGAFSLGDNEILWSSPGTTPVSTCQKNCAKCSSQLGKAENLALVKHALFKNFKEVWGIAVTSLSILGMILVIICALYFLMSFPVTVGTTVLGYMILFGLFLLYAVNFAFIISPTEGTCGVRRFGLGLAYAVIFSGMLVKVMNTWRIMGYNGSRMLNDGTRLSSPAGLLVIAVGLVIIQIVLSAAWLILMPPQIGAYEMVWRCAPPTTFEEGLVVSLVYVMLLLAITTLFAIMTWQCQDNNRESRWILACSTIVAVIWLTWTIISTQISPHHRDLTIAAANLVNATIIMVCLYLRKVYLYSQLTRQANDQDLKAHLQPSYPHSVYGSSQKSGPFSTMAPVLYGSQASLNGKKLYNGPSSRLELINCPEDNKSDSSGSVQVQAADLYPLDMYDGGSQFQPISSLFGSNHTLVLDDTLTFGR